MFKLILQILIPSFNVQDISDRKWQMFNSLYQINHQQRKILHPWGGQQALCNQMKAFPLAAKTKEAKLVWKVKLMKGFFEGSGVISYLYLKAN